ncbi:MULTISPECIES: hypothetical protein [Stenotrophomonas maltophilia group]|uniref:hypothetical protein n=1 Tax=Stenotrophomonas maltophilia group TaxID=995085 RepID=UPI0006A93EEE|nr:MULTISPECIES: hypothetical protein [Stenotrophomonas maltophilia group]MBA0271767.1 hypothetical protein [Stenotrophomonas maltophilia]MDT3489527.1 hypothetical protein [Stenotrophomonas maltophilia group sp. msm4]CRX67099.1 unnamed protein product [Stenotrophomonas maltophilia]
MFTFGREHEIKCAIRRHRKDDELQMVLAIINAIHDFKDGIVPIESALNAIRKGLVGGASGTWEAAGSWLCKLNKAHPTTECVWFELASHPMAKVRFRVACHMRWISEGLAARLYPTLAKDRSGRVREQAQGNWDCLQHAENCDGNS